MTYEKEKKRKGKEQSDTDVESGGNLCYVLFSISVVDG